MGGWPSTCLSLCAVHVNTDLCLQESPRPDGGRAAGARVQNEENGTRNGAGVRDEGQREAPEAARLRGRGALDGGAHWRLICFVQPPAVSVNLPTHPPVFAAPASP